MASVNKEHIYKVMADNDARFYCITDNGKVLDEQDNLAIDTNTAIEAMKEMFAGLTGSFVTVKISNKNKMEKGNGRSKDLFNREYTVTLTGDKAIAGVNQNNGMLAELINENKLLRQQILEEKHKAEIDAINRRFAELEEKQNMQGITGIPIIDSLFGNEQVQLAIVEKLTGVLSSNKVTALAGVNHSTEQLIEQIENVDPDFETVTLPLLAQLAVTKPDTYKQGIAFLKGSL